MTSLLELLPVPVPLPLPLPLLQVVTGPLAVAIALVTQLGDVWLLFAVVALAYWLDEFAPWVGRGLDRERAALVVALLVGAVALLEALKPFFAVARPPGFDVPPAVDVVPVVVEPVYAWMATAEGYGFPSGHALASTLVWGGLAWGIRVGHRRTRTIVASILVVSIAASRVLLGVHYLVDVAAGAAIGLAYLALVLRWLRDPGRAFALAAVIAVLGVAVTGVTVDGAATVGLAAGLTATWYWLGEELVATPATRPGSLVTTALGLLVAAPILVAAISIALPVTVVAAVGALGGGLLLALPLVGERIGLVIAGRDRQSATSP